MRGCYWFLWEIWKYEIFIFYVIWIGFKRVLIDMDRGGVVFLYIVENDNIKNFGLEYEG